jgi:hypothetical protein
MLMFFGLGALAAFARSDLTIPEAAAKAMAIYLMVAIGLKGGVAVTAEGFTTDLATAAILGLVVSVVLPLPAFWLVRWLGRQSATDAAAIAAHYEPLLETPRLDRHDDPGRSGARGQVLALTRALLTSWGVPTGLNCPRSRQSWNGAGSSRSANGRLEAIADVC